jgi:hypothetical protein
MPPFAPCLVRGVEEGAGAPRLPIPWPADVTRCVWPEVSGRRFVGSCGASDILFADTLAEIGEHSFFAYVHKLC